MQFFCSYQEYGRNKLRMKRKKTRAQKKNQIANIDGVELLQLFTVRAQTAMSYLFWNLLIQSAHCTLNIVLHLFR